MPARALPFADLALPSLTPRPDTPTCSREHALEIVERAVDFVAALAQSAIAHAWDSGRLSFAAGSDFPYQREVQGTLGQDRGRAETLVREAEDRVDALARGFRADFDGRDDGPLARLREELGLSWLGAGVLLVVAAPALRGELARLYGIIANDPGRAMCDELLVAQILGRHARRHEVSGELARLGRLGVVRGEGKAAPFRSLTVDPVIIAKLRADDETALDRDGVLTLAPEGPALEDLIMPPGPLQQLLGRLACGAPGGALRLVVRGAAGSGRRALLGALAARANRRLGVIDCALLEGEPRAFMAGLRRKLEEAVLRGWIPCVAGLDESLVEDKVRRCALAELFRSHEGPLTFRVAVGAGVPLDPGHHVFDIPVPSESERLRCWESALDRHRVYVGDVAFLAARYRVGAGVIERVAGDVAAHTPPGLSLVSDATEAIDQALRQHLDRRIGAVAERVTRLPTWEQLVLPDDLRDSIVELIGRVRHRRTVFESWGFDRTMSTSRGTTALFSGGPGTGKTMVAGILARELGLDLYRIDVSRILSKWMGETERNLAELFAAAEAGQLVLLFDEADSLFASRTEVKTSNDRFANNTVNFLLQKLDSFEGVAVLTTNFGSAIDAAFRRRLSLQLTFPFPDEEMREKLWRVHLPAEMPVAGELDLGTLARKYKTSGGYIRNAALRGAFLAAHEKAPVSQAHLERAVKLEYREGGKLSESGILE